MTSLPGISAIGRQTEFDLEHPAHVELSLYDLSGNLVQVLINDWEKQGHYTIRFNGQDNADFRQTGAFLACLKINGKIIQSIKITRI